MALEPAGGLTCTVTVAAGAPVERLDVDGHDESVPRAAWRKFDVGEEFVVEGQRMLRPRGGGGAGVVVSWSGERLERLRSYTAASGLRSCLRPRSHQPPPVLPLMMRARSSASSFSPRLVWRWTDFSLESPSTPPKSLSIRVRWRLPRHLASHFVVLCCSGITHTSKSLGDLTPAPLR
jgi:hypothetical protein